MIEARAVTNAFRFWIVVPMVLLVLAAGAASADPVEYDFVYVDAFQSQYDLRECYLFDVNNHGQACGWATDLDSGRIPNYSAFQWSAGNDKTKIPFLYARAINIAGKIAGWNHVFDPTSGSLVTIPQVPGAAALPVALDINDQDVVVGYAETCICSNSNRTLQIPFIWDAVGGSRSIPVPGSKELVKVNNANVAVGNIRGGSPDGFVYDIASGAVTRMSAFLPTNPYPWTEAADINDLGVVTGRHRTDDAQSFHGYVWSASNGATLLPHLESNVLLEVMPWGINDAGAVVGMAEIENHVWHAFVWDEENGIRDLNGLVEPPANFILDRALGINEQGWIVGDGHFGPLWSSSQAFVLVPRNQGPTLDVPIHTEILAMRVSPNPSRGASMIEYRLPAPGPVKIEVYDPSGRRLARIVNQELGAGVHVTRWDGRDGAGRPIPAGAYRVRLEAAGSTLVRSLALVR